MSEYQYYEFQSLDRPLSAAEQRALRAMSSRATITATSFRNSYDWGNFKGDPDKLIEKYFDLFLYLANWGTRRFSMRLPAGLIDIDKAREFILDEETATLRTVGNVVVLDVVRNEIEDDGTDDGSGWLAGLAPLRHAVAHGDLGVLYLVWLMAVEAELIDDDCVEPHPAPALSAPLQAFADFFALDCYLVTAATRAARGPSPPEPSREMLKKYLAGLAEREKDALFLRLYDGEAHLGAAFRRQCNDMLATEKTPQPLRTAGELRRSADVLAAAEERRHERKLAKEKTRKLDALEARGEEAWLEVERCATLRSTSGYRYAAALLADLRELADARTGRGKFDRQLAAIRVRHQRKFHFINALVDAGL